MLESLHLINEVTKKLGISKDDGGFHYNHTKGFHSSGTNFFVNILSPGEIYRPFGNVCSIVMKT